MIGHDYVEDNELLVELRNGAWLDQQDFPPLAYAIPGVLPEGSCLLVGPPKIGKSWFVLSLALAVASGGRALGAIEVGSARPTLYLALEDGDRRMQDRCRQLLGNDPIPPSFFYLTRVAPSRVIATITAWIRCHGDKSPLVIVDTLGKVMPPALAGESAYQRDYRIGGQLKRLCDDQPGLTLLINHHDRKAGAEDFVDSVSGTHGLAGAADTILVITRPRQESAGILKVTGRDVPEGEYSLRFDQGSAWSLDGPTLEVAAVNAQEARMSAGLSDRSAEVIAYVAQHPDGVRAADVERAIGADARRYLARLADSGRLHRLKRGVYVPVPTVPMSQDSNVIPLGHWDCGDRGQGGTPTTQKQ